VVRAATAVGRVGLAVDLAAVVELVAVAVEESAVAVAVAHAVAAGDRRHVVARAVVGAPAAVGGVGQRVDLAAVAELVAAAVEEVVVAVAVAVAAAAGDRRHVVAGAGVGAGAAVGRVGVGVDLAAVPRGLVAVEVGGVARLDRAGRGDADRLG